MKRTVVFSVVVLCLALLWLFGKAKESRNDPAVNAGTAQIADIISMHEPLAYLGELLAARDSVNYRWPDRRDYAISVWVQESKLNGYTPEHAYTVRAAFENWGESGVPVQYNFVADSSSAEVHVIWTDRFNEQTTGRTSRISDEDGWITEGRIVLALHQPDGVQLTRDEVRAIALHEVGHLIGLDHTSDSTSIMASRVRVSELSEADQATARLIYLLPPGSLRGFGR